MRIDHFLEGFDLTYAYSFLTLAGAFLSLYVMQVTSHYHENRNDPVVLQYSYRVGMALLALVFLWMFSYPRSKGWQPWPPFFVLLVVLNLMLVLRAVTINMAQTRRPSSQIEQLTQALHRKAGHRS